MNDQSIDGKLLFAQNMIENGKNVPDILAAMTDYGYDKAAMKEAKALFDRTSELHTKQKKEYGEQYKATDEMQLAKANANKAYMRHVKLARIALSKDRGAYETLQLSGDRKQTISGWIQQAKAFYTNALASEDYLAKLAKLNISKATLEAGDAAVKDVEAKRNKQFKEKGEAQNATVIKDESLEELSAWVSRYTEIARIALADNPQYLEMLGIIDPS